MGPVATALDGADRTFPSLEKILSASQPCSGRLPGRPLGMLELAYKGLGQKGGGGAPVSRTCTSCAPRFCESARGTRLNKTQ